MIYVLFICIVTPMTLMLFLLDKKSRLTVGFMLIGIFMCMFVSGINGMVSRAFPEYSLFYITTRFTPITEEIVKAIPVIILAFSFTDKRDTLISASLAVGIGFAVLENAYILVSNIDEVNIAWAVMRGFGSGLMHGICTAAVGIGISFVRKRKKLFYSGTVALLALAMIYHAIYNCLAQSDYPIIAYIMPIITYIPIVLVYFKKKERDKK